MWLVRAVLGVKLFESAYNFLTAK